MARHAPNYLDVPPERNKKYPNEMVAWSSLTPKRDADWVLGCYVRYIDYYV